MNSISLSAPPPQTVPTDSFSNCQPSLRNILEMNLWFKEEVVSLSIQKEWWDTGEWLENHATSDSIVSHHSCLLSQFCCVITHTLLQVETKTCSPVFAQIRKGNADRYSGSQGFPKCVLLLRWPHTDKPPVCLEHEINLIGAKSCSFLTLYIPDEGEQFPRTLCEYTVSQKPMHHFTLAYLLHLCENKLAPHGYIVCTIYFLIIRTPY